MCSFLCYTVIVLLPFSSWSFYIELKPAATMMLSTTSLLAIVPYILQVSAQASGTGTTTRYWDCCKPSCGWPGKATLASGSNPAYSCDINDNPLTNYNAVSGCNGGGAYMCSNESPWAVSDTLAYGTSSVPRESQNSSRRYFSNRPLEARLTSLKVSLQRQ